MDAGQLIQELSSLTKDNRDAVKSFKNEPTEALQFKPAPDRWSVLECIEHLNRYGDFYLPEIERRIQAARYKPSARFKPGFLGGRFAKSMLPKEKLNKMKAFKSMNPNFATLDEAVLETFIDQQERLLQLLEQAKGTNLTKVKTATSLSTWIKLRLGDTFRVVVYHNLRHIVQANGVLATLS